MKKSKKWNEWRFCGSEIPEAVSPFVTLLFWKKKKKHFCINHNVSGSWKIMLCCGYLKLLVADVLRKGPLSLIRVCLQIQGSRLPRPNDVYQFKQCLNEDRETRINIEYSFLSLVVQFIIIPVSHPENRDRIQYFFRN